MRLSTIAVPLIAVAIAALVVRVAIVEAYSANDPAKAALVWSSHPSIALASGLADVGVASRQGRPISRALVDRLILSSTKAPLAAEPFLVRGVDATVRGNFDLAGAAFLAARDRDPRTVAARYFLADHYLRTGQARHGLNEIAALTRLLPGSLAGVGPYLAAYARDPGATGEVRAMLARNPELEPVVLNALAADARDADLALSLWGGGEEKQLQAWQNNLLESLIAAGRYRKARSAWLRFTKRTESAAELVDADFAATDQGPFGWTLASGSSGVAEVETNDKLRIVYFGRDDLALATRILMFPPGRYRMSMQILGVSGSTETLAWTIECLPSGFEAMRSNLAGKADGVQGSSFEVRSSGCEAQRIRLAAMAGELPEKVQMTISDFRIEREEAE